MVYRARVTRVLDEGKVYAEVSGLGIGGEFGPLLTGDPTLSLNDRIIVDSVGSVREELVFLGRAIPVPPASYDDTAVQGRLTDLEEVDNDYDTRLDSLEGVDHTLFLLKSGGTMSGLLTLSADPSSSLHAASKQYVDSKFLATEIGNAVDLDSILTPGVYTQSQTAEAAAGTNYPVPVGGLLEVHADVTATHIWQRFTVYNGSTYIGQTFQRARYVTTWGPWKYVGGGDSPFMDRYRDTTLTMTTSTNYTVDFNVSDYQEGGITYSAGVASVPFAGKYSISSMINFQSASSTANISMMVLINGSVWRQMNYKRDGANESHAIDATVKLAANDTIAIRASQFTGADVTLYGVTAGIRYSGLQITYVNS